MTKKPNIPPQPDDLQWLWRLLDAQASAAGEGIIVVSTGHTFLHCNEMLAEMWGTPRDVIERKDRDGTVAHALKVVADPEAFKRLAGFDLTQSIPSIREDVPLKDGRFFECYASEVRDARGELLGCCWHFRDITVRKKLARQLVQEQVLTNSVLQNTPMGIGFLDANMVLRRWNKAARKLVETYLPGRTKGALGKNFFEHVPEAFMLEDWFRKTMQAGKRQRQTELRLPPDGPSEEATWWDMSLAPVLDPAGRPEGMVVIVDETTEQMRTAEALRLGEERYRRLFNEATLGICQSTLDGKVLAANPAFARMFGYESPQNLKSIMDIGSALHADPEERKAMVRQLLASPDILRMDTLCRRRDGTTFVGYASIRVVRDATGAPLYVEGILDDVTQLRQVEDALRQSEERYRRLFEEATLGISQASLDGKILAANPAFARMFGYASPEEVRAINPRDLIADPSRREGQIQQVLASRNPITFENLCRHKDGTTFTARITVQAVRDEQGNPLHLEGVIEDITQRTRAEEALRLSEERYRRLFEETTVAIIQSSLDGKVLAVNPAFAKVFGYASPQDVLNVRHVSRALYADESQRSTFIQEVLATNGPVVREVLCRRADGSTFPVHVNIRAVRDAQGQPLYLESFGEDITERKQAEEALRLSEERYRNLFQETTLGICQTDLQGKILVINPACIRMFGYPSMEAGLKADVRPCYVDSKQMEDVVRQALASLGPIQFEALYRRLDGSTFTARAILRAVRNTQGQPLYLEGILEDITHRKEAEEALRQSEDRLRLAIESAELGTWDFDPLTGKLNWSDRCKALFGLLPGDEVDYQAFLDRLHPDDRERVHALVQHALDSSGDGRYDTEYRSRWPDGTERWIIAGGRAFFAEVDGRRQAIRFIGTVLDDTDRKQVEEALRRERDFANNLFDSAQTIVLILDASGQLARFNPLAQHLTGFRENEVIGKYWGDVLRQPSGETGLARLFERCLRGQSAQGAVQSILARDGRELVIRWYCSALFDEQGHVTGLQAIGSDISDLRQKEEQFRQSQKLEAVGRLAGGIAHDFNNQLTVVKGYCDLLLKSSDLPEMLRQALGEIRTASTRAATLTSQLLTFSRQQVLRPEVVNLNQVLKELVGPLATLIGEHIQLSLIADPNLGNVRVDRTQVEQAVMNLTINAGDAMPKGGKLTIETRNVELDPHHVTQYPDANIGPHVLLSVTDTGSGMDVQTLKRIFEPFFTTKPVGAGTGLGLAMVHGFVNQSGGHVTVSSQPGHGSTFRIYLPQVQAAETEHEVVACESPSGCETILVVEDAPLVRQMVVRTLSECGYQVLEAPSPRQALAVSDGFHATIDLLLSDVVLPEMSGPQMAQILAQRRQDMKILYMTGYAPDSTLPRPVGDKDFNLLSKPFEAHELAQKVRKLLDEE